MVNTLEMRPNMTNAEAERLDLHIGLKKVLGDDMADKLMSHLPPTGWSDIARRSEMLARFDLVDQRFEFCKVVRFDSECKQAGDVGMHRMYPR